MQMLDEAGLLVGRVGREVVVGVRSVANGHPLGVVAEEVSVGVDETKLGLVRSAPSQKHLMMVWPFRFVRTTSHQLTTGVVAGYRLVARGAPTDDDADRAGTR